MREEKDWYIKYTEIIVENLSNLMKDINSYSQKQNILQTG